MYDVGNHYNSLLIEDAGNSAVMSCMQGDGLLTNAANCVWFFFALHQKFAPLVKNYSASRAMTGRSLMHSVATLPLIVWSIPMTKRLCTHLIRSSKQRPVPLLAEVHHLARASPSKDSQRVQGEQGP